MRAGLLLVSVATLSSSGLAQDGGYTFVIDGEEVEPEIRSLRGTPDQPQAGDLVEIDDVHLRLGAPGTRRLRPRESAKTGRWLVEMGTERVVGCDTKGLLSLDTEGRRKLEGVRIEDWDDAIREAVADLDFETVAITITDGAAQGEGRALPKLPAGLRALVVETNSPAGIRDWRVLAGLTELRFFRLSGCPIEDWSFDLSVLGGACQLRYVGLGEQRVRNVGTLARLAQLRFLQLGGKWPAPDVSFVDELPELRTLHVWTRGLKDLGLQKPALKLVELDVSGTALEGIPGRLFPNLLRLKVGRTRIRLESVLAFRRANPKCYVYPPSDQKSLDQVLGRCDRIRVRTGGTCCRQRVEEKTLFFVREPEELRMVLAAFRIEESPREFRCLCCGSPTFELFSKWKLIASLGLHHGSSIRWGDGPWSGDARLTPRSQESLVRWLAAKGVSWPHDEWLGRQYRGQAARLRWDNRRKLLPPDTAGILGEEGIEQGIAKILTEKVDDVGARAALAFRLLGCHEGVWNERDEFDRGIEGVLDKMFDSKSPVGALLAAARDRRAAIGAASWLFHESRMDYLQGASAKGLLGIFARHGLEHPQATNRRLTLRVLKVMQGAEATSILRQVLDGKYQPRTVPRMHLAGTGGPVRIYYDEIIHRPCSDRALAALCLAARGDQASKARIQSLLERAQGAEREALADALARLAKK